jgi:hypothetical protein
MPRKYELSWDGEPCYRWVKMYRGRRYRVSCADLGLPREAWTKELSYRAANEWWARKRAELDGPGVEHPHAETLADLTRKLAYAGRHGLADEAATLAGQVEEVRAAPPTDGTVFPADPETERRLEAARLLGVIVPEDLDPHALAVLFGQERVWGERFRRERLVPAERTVGGLAGWWAGLKAEEARQGVRSADGADNTRIALSHFTTFAGEASPVESVDADLWHRWYVHCAGQVARRDGDRRAGWSADYAAKVFGVSRSFVRWLWEREVLPALPRNLESKRYRFSRPDRVIPTFTDDEVRLLLGAAAGQHRLHLLLMLNIGATQKDISDLRKDQIDLAGAAITRRRSKTARQKNVPLVRYPLWPETARLLREHLSADPVYALLTHTGRRWVRKDMGDDGRLKKADNVATLFQHLKRKVGLAGEGKSLKVFRKTSATRLKGHPKYRDLRFWFLGHSARTVADRHYAAESDALMREAVEWLGRGYGLVT